MDFFLFQSEQSSVFFFVAPSSISGRQSGAAALALISLIVTYAAADGTSACEPGVASRADKSQSVLSKQSWSSEIQQPPQATLSKV